MTTRRATTKAREQLSAYFTPQEFADRYRESIENTLRRIRQHAAAPGDGWTVRAINTGTALRPKYLIPRAEVDRFDQRTDAA